MDVVLLFSMVIGLLLIGVPIAISLGPSSTIFLLIYSESSLASVAGTLLEAFVGHYTLLAIPFFILASSFMSTGGVAQRIIRFAIAVVGHLPGGLAIAGVFAYSVAKQLVKKPFPPSQTGIWRMTYLDERVRVLRASGSNTPDVENVYVLAKEPEA